MQLLPGLACDARAKWNYQAGEGGEIPYRGEFTVQTPKLDAPKFVRMGWQDTATPNLRDKNGRPVRTFPAKKID